MTFPALERISRMTWRWAICSCLLAGAASAGDREQAKAAGGPYTLQSTRIAGGAGTAAGGTFSVSGTVGQHDATVVSAQGGSYDVAGGLQPAAPATPPTIDSIFANGFE